MRVSMHLMKAELLERAAELIAADVECQYCHKNIKAGNYDPRYRCVKCRRWVCGKCCAEKRGRPKDRQCVCLDHGKTIPLPIDAKLAGTATPKLRELWNTWSPETLLAYYKAIRVWHEGTGYMHTEENEFTDKTPLDDFESAYPEEWKSYTEIVAASAPKIPLFRTLILDQADDLVEELLATTGDTREYLMDELWSCLEWQNQLHIRTKPVTNETLVDHPTTIEVRRFSSWTSQANVAFQLSFQGGVEPIGDGAVIVASEAYPRVVHTFDAAIEFEKWCAENKEKTPECKPFMAKWRWQVEYVVESQGTIQCNRLEVVGVEGSHGYYEQIRDAAGFDEDDDDDI